MQQTDDQQPEHSPEPQRTWGAARFGGLGSEEEDAHPEEHGEEAHHLEVEDGSGEDVRCAIRSCELEQAKRVHVGAERRRHRADVHREDAEEGKAAEHVERFQPLGRGDGRGLGRHGQTIR